MQPFFMGYSGALGLNLHNRTALMQRLGLYIKIAVAPSKTLTSAMNALQSKVSLGHAASKKLDGA